jgi:heme/copper-type cytochrome/quinol oxidase subunit 2
VYSQTRTVQIRQIVLFVLLKKFAKEMAKTAELKGKALMLDTQMLKNEMEKAGSSSSIIIIDLIIIIINIMIIIIIVAVTAVVVIVVITVLSHERLTRDI